MILTYTLKRSDYKAFWWKSLFHWKTLKQVFIIWLVFSILVIATDHEDWITREDWPTIILSKLLISIGITTLLLVIFLFKWRRYDLFNGPVGDCQLEMKTDCFILRDQNVRTYVFPMNTMRFISQNKDLLFLYFGNRDGFPIPKSAFNNDKLAADFFNLMEKVKRENLPYIAEEAFNRLFKSSH